MTAPGACSSPSPRRRVRLAASLALLLLLGAVAPLAGATRPMVTRREYVEAFMAHLGESPEQVRSTYGRALGWIGPTALPAAPRLVLLLGDRRAPVRAQAARALARLGPAAVPQVLKGLVAASPRARIGAARALGAMGPGARPALGKLAEIAAREDEDPRVRRAAWAARERIRRPWVRAPGPATS